MFTLASEWKLTSTGDFLDRPKHIEVQILSDRYSNHVHLFERDCSVQRKHQKVIEFAPSPNLLPQVRQGVFDAAVRLARFLNYGKLFFFTISPMMTYVSRQTPQSRLYPGSVLLKAPQSSRTYSDRRTHWN